MIQDLFTLKGALHPTAIGDGFIIPLFRMDEGDPRPSFVQHHDNASIISFEEVDTSEDVVLSLNATRQVSIGDRPLFGFKSRSKGILVGNSMYLRSALESVREEYFHRPATLASVDRFIGDMTKGAYADESAPIEVEDLSAGRAIDLRTGGQAQRYLDANKLERDFVIAREKLRRGDLSPYAEDTIRAVLSVATIKKFIDPSAQYFTATNKRRLVWAVNAHLNRSVFSGLSELLGGDNTSRGDIHRVIGNFVEFRLRRTSKDLVMIKSQLAIASNNFGKLEYACVDPSSSNDNKDEFGYVFQDGITLKFVGHSGRRLATRIGQVDHRGQIIKGVLVSQASGTDPFATSFVMLSEESDHPLLKIQDAGSMREAFERLIERDAMYI